MYVRTEYCTCVLGFPLKRRIHISVSPPYSERSAQQLRVGRLIPIFLVLLAVRWLNSPNPCLHAGVLFDVGVVEKNTWD